MPSIPAAGLAKALIVVTVSMHPGAAHHDPGSYTVRPGRSSPARASAPGPSAVARAPAPAPAFTCAAPRVPMQRSLAG